MTAKQHKISSNSTLLAHAQVSTDGSGPLRKLMSQTALMKHNDQHHWSKWSVSPKLKYKRERVPGMRARSWERTICIVVNIHYRLSTRGSFNMCHWGRIKHSKLLLVLHSIICWFQLQVSVVKLREMWNCSVAATSPNDIIIIQVKSLCLPALPYLYTGQMACFLKSTDEMCHFPAKLQSYKTGLVLFKFYCFVSSTGDAACFQ